MKNYYPRVPSLASQFTLSFFSRAVFLIIFTIAFFVLLLVRLFDLQIIRGDYFLGLADDNRFYNLEVPSQRGVFLDRYGKPLVYNAKQYYELGSSELLFTDRLPISREESLVKMASGSSLISFELRRFYPYANALSHTIGYVGPVTVEDLLQQEHLDIADQIGKLGLEKQYDQSIKGIKGKEVYEINTFGEKQRLVERKEAQKGFDVATSIDPYLSQVAARALAGKKGVLIISDASNGEVLALISSPSFDANDFNNTYLDENQEEARKNRISSYLSNENKVFFNRAISGAYPPGSIFKLVTALAGLRKGAIDENTSVIDEGILKVGEWEYANWYYTQYGRTEGAISLVRAISRSNDIYFYKAAEFTGPNDLAQMAREFGFGSQTGIELGGEVGGIVPDPEWKERVIGERWYLGNTYHFGIGQGDLLVTPIQVSQMVQAIANKGRLCRATLLKDQDDRCTELGLDEYHTDLVLRGMLNACSSGGTAYPFFPWNEKKRGEDEKSAEIVISRGAIACKTGTAEFGAADARGYRKTHGWLTAIVGVDSQRILQSAGIDPEEEGEEATAETELDLDFNVGKIDREAWLEKVKKYGFPERLVIVALVESDGENPFMEGSKDAAPVVKEVMDWVYGEKSD